MRVSVYKGLGQDFTVLLEPSPGRGLHPVLLPDLSAEDWREKVRTAIDSMRQAPAPTRP